MDYKSFENYIKLQRGSVSIPEVQQVFNCSYKQAKEVINSAVENNLLSYIGGIYYEINKDAPQKDAEDLRARFENFSRTTSEKWNKEKNSDGQSGIKDYIAEKKTVTIPALQKQFNLDYEKASKLVSGLVNDKFIEYNGGLNYVVIEQKEDDIEKICADLKQKRLDLIRRMQEFKDEYERYGDEENENEEEENVEEEDDDFDFPSSKNQNYVNDEFDFPRKNNKDDLDDLISDILNGDSDNNDDNDDNDDPDDD